MTVPTDVVNRMIVEIMRKKKPARPDTPEEAEFRTRLKADCDEIVRKGGEVDVPSEIPDL